MGRVAIEAGGFYASGSECFAREVLEFIGKDVMYRDFALSDGRMINPRSRCTLAIFQRWVARRLTADEGISLHRNLLESRAPKASSRPNIASALAGVNDEDLIEEIRRRGAARRERRRTA